MIGIVTPQLRAIVHVPVRGPLWDEVVEATVDTGFDGYLTLPMETIQRLGLPFLIALETVLANGSSVQVDVYAAAATLDDDPIAIEVVEAANIPLLGMSLLHGYDVHLQVADGGTVEIEPLR